MEFSEAILKLCFLGKFHDLRELFYKPNLQIPRSIQSPDEDKDANALIQCILGSQRQREHVHDDDDPHEQRKIQEDYIRCIRLLLDKGKVPLNSKDEKGRTPLHWAIRCSNVDMVAELASCSGAKANLEDKEGLNAVNSALRHGATECLLPLVQHFTTKVKSTIIIIFTLSSSIFTLILGCVIVIFSLRCTARAQRNITYKKSRKCKYSTAQTVSKTSNQNVSDLIVPTLRDVHGFFDNRMSSVHISCRGSMCCVIGVPYSYCILRKRHQCTIMCRLHVYYNIILKIIYSHIKMHFFV